MTDTDLVVVWAKPDDDEVSGGLRRLTETIGRNGLGEISGGLFGGEFGYGAYFENDTFMMHPFCWCEESGCPWCVGCSCQEVAVRYVAGDMEVAFDDWLAFKGDRRCELIPELACPYCKGEVVGAPNFLHKTTGSQVRWYKYIGRGMEVELKGEWTAILADCLNSLQRVA